MSTDGAGDRFDLVVIGGGSGGVRAARMAAAQKKRVAIVEESRLGGTCVNVGCIPKKLLSYGAHFRELFTAARGYGYRVDVGGHDFAALMAAKDQEIARLNGVYRRLLERSGVVVVEGRGRLVGANEVRVGEHVLRTSHVLIATGGRPARPDIPGAELGAVSDDVFALAQLPARTLVVGGGYIGVEMASILHGLGSDVTLTYRGPLFLRGFDDDARSFLADEMRKKGVTLLFDRDVVALSREGDALLVELSDGECLRFDFVLFATGRVPNSDGLGLDEVGVARDAHGAIVVDRFFRTSVASVFAVGDVIGGIQLTPVALAQGMAVARSVVDGTPTPCDLTHVPTAIFSHPNMATVGLSEREAREHHARVHVYRSSFTPLLHTLSGVHEKMFMKLVVDGDSDAVLGVHVVGAEAGEIVQGFAAAMQAGVTKAMLDATIGIHPTAAEELVTMRERVPDPTPPSPH